MTKTNIHIILSAQQAAAYYNEDDAVRKPVMEKVFARAQRQANKTGRVVEIHHPDGFLVEYVAPDPYADLWGPDVNNTEER